MEVLPTKPLDIAVMTTNIPTTIKNSLATADIIHREPLVLKYLVAHAIVVEVVLHKDPDRRTVAGAARHRRGPPADAAGETGGDQRVGVASGRVGGGATPMLQREEHDLKYSKFHNNFEFFDKKFIFRKWCATNEKSVFFS